LARCLDPRPEKRFENVRRLLSELDGSRWRTLHKTALVGAAGALVLLGILAVAALANHEDQVSDLLRLTPETDYSSSPSLSSDGRWIVYSTNRAESGNEDIWIDSAKGQAARRLTTNRFLLMGASSPFDRNARTAASIS
jgi:hypothetical protein